MGSRSAAENEKKMNLQLFRHLNKGIHDKKVYLEKRKVLTG